MKLYDNKSKQEINFFIPDQYKSIAVNCSGGADSSILLYTIVKFLEENNRNDTKVSVLTCANDRKGRWNAKHASSVINFIIEKTKTRLINSHFVYYRDVQDVKYFHEVEFGLFKNKKIDLVISGVTANPTEEAIVENINKELVNLKDEALLDRNGTNHETWNHNNDANWYTPFVNVDKRFISHLYSYFNVEDLFSLTRSCEDFNAENTNNYTEPCGKCWWCLERKWAFDRF
jgi:7-cyano-7-deazaguanine synthase in queuosine biosynthesis